MPAPLETVRAKIEAMILRYAAQINARTERREREIAACRRAAASAKNDHRITVDEVTIRRRPVCHESGHPALSVDGCEHGHDVIEITGRVFIDADPNDPEGTIRIYGPGMVLEHAPHFSTVEIRRASDEAAR